jgi:arylsulfatase A-like enzyme
MDSLFTGMPVERHGGGLALPEGGYSRPSAGSKRLPELLAAAGYRTQAFACNPYLTRRFGFDRGFQTFVHADAWREPFLVRHAFERLRHQLTGRVERLRRERDGRLVEAAATALRSGSAQPTFTWVHLLAPHEYARDPGGPVPGWQPDTRDPALLRAAYRASVAASGERLARLLAAVDFQRTLVVVTADHGERLGERGLFGHGLELCDEELRIPLALRGSGVVPGWEPRQVGSQDLRALLLRVAQGDEGLGLEPRDALPVAGLRHGRAAEPAALRLEGGSYRLAEAAPLPAAPAPPLDPETRAALRALGYQD